MLDGAIDELLAEHDPKTTDDVDVPRRPVTTPAWRGSTSPRASAASALRPELQHARRAAAARRPARTPTDPATFFMALAGPTIVTHGSDEQQAALPAPDVHRRGASGASCSPSRAPAPTSPASPRKAVRDGDEWIVNGQKVWNTLAHLADCGMLVARTDPDAPKHKGMTYFALDMHAPGVEVRPLRQITGEAEFNEVYITDVRIPDADRIGDVGEGWRVVADDADERAQRRSAAAAPVAASRGGAAPPTTPSTCGRGSTSRRGHGAPRRADAVVGQAEVGRARCRRSARCPSGRCAAARRRCPASSTRAPYSPAPTTCRRPSRRPHPSGWCPGTASRSGRSRPRTRRRGWR